MTSSSNNHFIVVFGREEDQTHPQGLAVTVLDGNINENVNKCYLSYFVVILTHSTCTKTENYPETKLVGFAAKGKTNSFCVLTFSTCHVVVL